jgi:hypothetical protein
MASGGSSAASSGEKERRQRRHSGIRRVLWLYLQYTRKAEFPRECARLLNYAFKHAWINDFSFDGVNEQIERRFGAVLSTPISGEQEAEARRMISPCSPPHVVRHHNLNEVADGRRVNRAKKASWLSDSICFPRSRKNGHPG